MVPPACTLASTSPRRAALLCRLGLPFDVIDSGVVEAALLAPPDPSERVRSLARAKALAVAVRVSSRPVLGADTLVALEGAALGKPADPADAERMLHALSGRTHDVHTGVALVVPGSSGAVTAVVSTAVRFRRLTGAEIRAYVATGEPLDKAGAYGIQGGARPFVAEVRGCFTNVIGLPLCLVADMLREVAGLPAQCPPDGDCRPTGQGPITCVHSP